MSHRHLEIIHPVHVGISTLVAAIYPFLMPAARARSGESASRGGSKLERVERWVVLATVASVPLIHVHGWFSDAYGLPKANALLVGVGIASCVRGVRFLAGDGATFPGRASLPVAFFLVALLASWLATDYRGYSVFGAYERYLGVVPYAAVAAICLLVADNLRERRKELIAAIAISGVGASLFSIGQLLFAGEWISRGSDTGYVVGTIGQSTFLGAFLAMSLPSAVSLWVRARSRRTSAIWAGVTALTATAWMATFSQAALLGGLVGLAILIGHLLSPRMPRALLLSAAVAVAAALLAAGSVVVFGIAPNLLGDRFAASTGTVYHRSLWWTSAIDIAGREPVVGNGPDVHALLAARYRDPVDGLIGGNTIADDPHSVPLAMLANLGILGVASLVAVFAAAFFHWRRSPQDGDIWAAACAAACGVYAIHALVSLDEISVRTTAWACAGSLLSLGGSWNVPRSRWFRISVGLLVAALGLAAVVGGTLALAVSDLRTKDAIAAIEEAPAEGLDALVDREPGWYPGYHHEKVVAFAVGDRAAEEAGNAAALAAARHAYERLRWLENPQIIASEARSVFVASDGDQALLAEAADLYRDARRLDPYNFEHAIGLTDTLLHLGYTDEAVTTMKAFHGEVVENNLRYVGDPEVFGALALALVMDGRTDEARQALNRNPLKEQGTRCRGTLALTLMSGTRNAGLGFVCPQIMMDLIE